MKKLNLLATIFLIIISMALVSCDSQGNTPKPCDEHTDTNGDYLCDVCEAELPNPATCQHADTNTDYKCDICKTDLPNPATCQHADTNTDYKCDICKTDLPNPETCQHADANTDYKCDICKTDLPNPATCQHTDTNTDYKCDICKTELPNPATCQHSDTNHDLECDLCKSFVDDAVVGWLLEGVPRYKGGTLSSDTYIAGQGYATEQLLANENLMQAVSDTNDAEFSAYLAKLEKAGFTKEFYREADSNLFASYISGTVRVYAYYMSRIGEARIVKEKANVSVSLEDFGYSYEKKEGEASVIYQFALPMNDNTHAKPDYKDNGMLYIVKLADNSVIIIDGGAYAQFPNERRNALLNMLRDITETEEGEQIKIAAWFVTHPHADHFVGFKRFVEKYSSQLELQRVFWGFPSLNSPNKDFTEKPEYYHGINGMINDYFEDDSPMFMRLHTGQLFNLADASIEVLYTHEDGVDATTGESYITDINDASTVIRITIDGESFVVLGDLNKKSGAKNLIANWSEEHLKSDCVQIAHHGMNPIQNLYSVLRAEVLFVPQSQYGIELYETRMDILNAAKAYAREDMVFFQNEVTVGIAVKGGKWEVVYNEPYEY